LEIGDSHTLRVLLAQVESTTSWTYYGVNIAVLILILFLTALVAGSEVAFFSLTADQRAICQESENSSEKRISRLLDNPSRLLATLLIFTNLLNITFVTITAVMTKQALGQDAEALMGLLVQTVGVTFLIVFFGELIPKVWANQNSLTFLKITAPLIEFANWIFKPIAVPLLAISNLIEQRVKRKGYSISIEHLNQALDLTTESDTTQHQKEILRGIVNFSHTNVRQIMRSRMEITGFEHGLNFHELMDKINKSGYSRVPVYKETIDNVVGVVYVKDFLPHLEKDEYFNWQEIIRPPFFVPESKKIDDLLYDFQAKRVHMAIVINEYGETEGLITLEDIIEEIIGDIQDEFDEEEIDYTKLDDNNYIFEGKVPLNDVCKVLDSDLDDFEDVRGESESLGGLLLELFGRLPNASETIEHKRFIFRVLSADNKRIKKIKITIKNEESSV
jgi:putative hemolysin